MRLQFLAFSGVMLVLAIVVLVESATLVIWTPLGPGPGFFTSVLGIVLVGLALGVAWDERKRALGGIVDEEEPEDEPEPATVSVLEVPTELVEKGRPGGTHKLVLVAASLVPIPFLLEPLGFRITIFALIAYLLVYVEQRRWWSSLIGAALISGIAYYLFSDLLSVPLPLGPLGL